MKERKKERRAEYNSFERHGSRTEILILTKEGEEGEAMCKKEGGQQKKKERFGVEPLISKEKRTKTI